MNGSMRLPQPPPRPASACEVTEIRRVTSRPPPSAQNSPVRLVASDRAPGVDSDDVTRLDLFVRDWQPEDIAVTENLLAELKRRLRAAEAREDAEAIDEASGIRVRPTPPEGLDRPSDSFALAPVSDSRDLDPLEDLEIEVEPLRFERQAKEEPSRLDETRDEADRLAPPRHLGAIQLGRGWQRHRRLPIQRLAPAEVELPRLGAAADKVDDLPELEVAIAPQSESNFYGGFDADNPDGVFVATHYDLAIGTPVYLSVHLPGGFGFRSAALVDFVREPATSEPTAGLGLRLCGLTGPMRRLIREFVKYRPPMFYLD